MISLELQKEIGNKHKTFLVVIPSQKYNENTNELILSLTHNFNRVAYVSLNKLINPLKRTLQEKNVDMKKVFFIDGITKTAIPNPPEAENCVFVPSPDDLTKLSISITKVFQTFDPDCLFFDSLSTLLIYKDVNMITQFVHSLLSKVNAFGTMAVFTCLQGEKEEHMVKDLSLIIDKVIEEKPQQ
ncbi:hypothetical protein JXA85_03915 [Candidatus Woesearchaeota archaeon]|nr:hypothetical protein [Candidatus Woesearchaeota archaeon]